MRSILLILAFFVIQSAAFADIYYLKSGTKITGKTVLSNENTIIVENEEDGKQIIPVSSLYGFSSSDPDTTVSQPVETSGNSFKNFSIFLNLGSTYLLSGKMYDYLHNGFRPTPDYICSGIYGIGVDWYFLKYLGLSLGFDYYLMMVSFPQGYNSLFLASGSTVKPMLVGRIPFKPFIDREDCFMGLALRAFVGGTYNTFGYSDDYKKIVEKSLTNYTISWYASSATGFGFIGGIGLLFEYNHLGCGLDLIVQQKTLRYPEDGKDFDWFELGSAFRVSFDF